MYGKGYDKTCVIDFTGEQADLEWVSSKLKKWYPQNTPDLRDCFAAVPVQDITDKLADRWRHDHAITKIQTVITHNSRLYLIGHGGKNCDYLTDEAGKHLSISDLGKFLNILLMKPEFRVNQSKNNITISLVVCYAGYTEDDSLQASFAGKLQTYLQRTFNIYVNILARVSIVTFKSSHKTNFRYAKFTVPIEKHEEYTHHVRSFDNTTELHEKYYLANRYLSPLEQHKLAKSKLFYMWQPDGSRITVDAYEYKESL